MTGNKEELTQSAKDWRVVATALDLGEMTAEERLVVLKDVDLDAIIPGLSEERRLDLNNTVTMAHSLSAAGDM